MMDANKTIEQPHLNLDGDDNAIAGRPSELGLEEFRAAIVRQVAEDFELEAFRSACRTSILHAHDGTAITPEDWSGFAKLQSLNGDIVYSASLKRICGDVMHATKCYQRISLCGFVFSKVEGLEAIAPDTIFRTQIVYRREVDTEDALTHMLSWLQTMNLRGGRGRRRTVVETTISRGRTIVPVPRPVAVMSAPRRTVIVEPSARRVLKETDVVETTTTRRRNRRRKPKQVAIYNGPRALNLKNSTVTSALGKSRYSAGGRAWLELYLNPMGKQEPALAGYPDGSSTDAVIAQYRQDFYLTVPGGTQVYNVDNTPYTNGQWDTAWAPTDNLTVSIISPPCLSYVAMVTIYKTTPTAMETAISGSTISAVYPYWQAYGTSGVPVTTANATVDFIRTYVVLDSVADHCSKSSAYRMISRGLTGEYSVPQLETQGFVTCAQADAEPALMFGTTPVLASATNTTDTPSPITTTTTQVINQTYWGLACHNLSPSALVQTYRTAYTNKAVDGFYMPLMNNEQNLKFLAPWSKNLVFYDPATRVSSATLFRDYLTEGWNTGVVWFESISIKFAIKLKTRTVVELAPSPGTDITNFARTSANNDRRALEAAFDLRHVMAHAYPSCYNSWGWLGDLVEGAIGLVPGGKFLAPFVKPAWNWLGGKVSNWFGNPVVRDGETWYDAEN